MSRQPIPKRPPTAEYTVKITLDGIRPPIWRRVVVPDTITLAEFSGVIIAAMGWLGHHMHIFEVGDLYLGEPDRELGVKSDHKVVLGQVLPTVKSRIKYVYDFGDDWRHTVLLEKIIPAFGQPVTITCLAARHACPLEDCGGIWGYAQLLETQADPNHPDHADLMEWLDGKLYDPDYTDVERICAAMKAFNSDGPQAGE